MSIYHASFWDETRIRGEETITFKLAQIGRFYRLVFLILFFFSHPTDPILVDTELRGREKPWNYPMLFVYLTLETRSWCSDVARELVSVLTGRFIEV